LRIDGLSPHRQENLVTPQPDTAAEYAAASQALIEAEIARNGLKRPGFSLADPRHLARLDHASRHAWLEASRVVTEAQVRLNQAQIAIGS
jgi:hypothetical protein